MQSKKCYKSNNFESKDENPNSDEPDVSPALRKKT